MILERVEQICIQGYQSPRENGAAQTLMGFISGNRKIYKHDRKILSSNLGIWGEEVSKSMKVANFLKREKGELCIFNDC